MDQNWPPSNFCLSLTRGEEQQQSACALGGQRLYRTYFLTAIVALFGWFGFILS